MSRRWQVLWVVMLFAMLASIAWRWADLSFNAQLQKMLPDQQQVPVVISQATTRYQNDFVLLLSHPDADLVKTLLPDLKNNIQSLPGVLQSRLDPYAALDPDTMVRAFAAYPLSLLSKRGEDARKSDNYTFIVGRYIRLMSQPANPLVSRTAGVAPLMNLADWLSQSQHGGWHQDNGMLYRNWQGQRYYALFVRLGDDGQSIEKAPLLVNKLDKLLLDLPEDVQILRTGMVFHTAAATSQAKFEMQLFGGLSALGVLLLTLFSFRKLRPTVLIVILVGSSVIAGLFALTALFSTIHLLALVFSVSLIGIAVDYGYHVLSAAKYTGLRGQPLIRLLRPALLVSAVTTIVCYGMLVILPIDLLKQVGVFVSGGLAFALLTSFILLTDLPGGEDLKPAEQATKEHPGLCLTLMGLVALGVLLSVGGWTFGDDIRLFNSTPEALRLSEQQSAKIMDNQQYPRLLSFRADDEESMWQGFEKIRSAFELAGLNTEDLNGLDRWVPSLQRQRQNALWLKEGLTSGALAQVHEYLDEATVNALLKAPGAGLTLADIPAELREAYPPILELNGSMHAVLSYAGAIDADKLSLIQQQLPFELQLYDQPARLSASLQKLRHYLTVFLALSGLIMLLLLSFRYGLFNSLKITAMILLVVSGSLSVTHLVSGYISLFSVLACVLILALLLDYLIFIAEHGKPDYVQHAILLSAITSMLAFGMLAFSQTPALHQFGLTLLSGIAMGVLLCWLLPRMWIRRVSE